MVGLHPLPTGFFLAPEEAPRKQLFSDSKAYARTSRPLPKEGALGRGLCAPRSPALRAPGAAPGRGPPSTLRLPRGDGGTTRAHLRAPAPGPGPAGHRWDEVHSVSMPARSRRPGGPPTPALGSRAAVCVTAAVRLRGPAGLRGARGTDRRPRRPLRPRLASASPPGSPSAPRGPEAAPALQQPRLGSRAGRSRQTGSSVRPSPESAKPDS